MSAVFSHSGCSLQGLLSGESGTLMPECDMNDDGSCSCAINASSGRYSVMYDSTSIEANAVYASSPDLCYNGSEDLTRMCQMTGEWSGNQPDPDDFTEGNLTSAVPNGVHEHVWPTPHTHVQCIYTSIIFTCSIRESVNSMCRDGADMPKVPYIHKPCNLLNATFLSLFK